MQFHEATLANGLKVIAEINPAVHSVAVGFWVRTGARDEIPEINGVSHFLEHMVFKGTDRFSAHDVNRVFDEVGAEYNASTSEEITMFYAAILPEYLPRTFELLADILFPALRDDDFDMEKKVILEEISMYQDQPMHVAYENAMLKHFSGHPLGVSILGSQQSVGGLTAEQTKGYHAEHYRAGNITLSVAGNTDWKQVLELAEKFCGRWQPGAHQRPIHEARPEGGELIILREASVQQNLVLVTSAPSAQNPMRFAAELLSMIVGDDGNSRMYWELVDPGLVEFAELSHYDYDGSGSYMTWLCCQPETTEENLAMVREILERVNREGITTEELDQARNRVASRIVLRSERPMGRLSSLGANWLYRQEYRSVADDLATLQALTVKDLNEALEAYPLGVKTLVAVGPRESLGQT